MFSLNHRRIFPLIAPLVLGPWSLVILIALAASAWAQPANVQADPTTGALTRPTTATFVSGNSLLTPTSTSTLTNKSISGATNTLTAIPLTTAVTGTLPAANGGTGVTTSTGTGSVVLSASPTLTGTIGAASLSLSSLTSGRVPYVTTAGLLTDASTLTFSAGTLTASAYIGASLTAPTSTALTLTGGSTGASLVLGHTAGASMSSASKLNLTNSEASVGSTSGALRVTGGIYAGAASVLTGLTTTGLNQFDVLNAAARALIVGPVGQSGGNLPYASIKTSASFADFALNVENTNSTSGQGLGLRIVSGSTASDLPLFVRDRTNATTLFSVGGTGAATVAGAVTAASLATTQTPSTAVSVVSTHKVPIVLNGTTYYILLTNVP